MASVFHDTRWLEALSVSYGYEPLVLTTSTSGQTLQNGWPFCEIKSWITGKRWVSLPFSDHSDPLIGRPEELAIISKWLEEQQVKQALDYIETRPSTVNIGDTSFRESASYFIHTLSLEPSAQQLFEGLHRHGSKGGYFVPKEKAF